MLDQPHLARRIGLEGIHELHPVDWSLRRRTFVVERGEFLLGTAELLRDEEDPETWELGVTMFRAGEGGRAAAAALFYAFEELGAQTVWFWGPRRPGMMRFARRFGFVKLLGLKLPGGHEADAYELERRSWLRRRGCVLENLTRAPLVLRDGRCEWRGQEGRLEPCASGALGRSQLSS